MREMVNDEEAHTHKEKILLHTHKTQSEKDTHSLPQLIGWIHFLNPLTKAHFYMTPWSTHSHNSFMFSTCCQRGFPYCNLCCCTSQNTHTPSLHKDTLKENHDPFPTSQTPISTHKNPPTTAL